MKTSGSRLSALLAGCVTIAACSQATELPRFQYAPTVSNTSGRGAGPLSYRVLHSFGGDHDGDYPVAGLVGGSGAFYGTTSGGGSYGRGTVFTVEAGGSEKVLRSFDKGFRGRYPYAGVIDVNGTLYGTTPYGGGFGDGTVFSIAPDGSEKVLHSFGRRGDGEYPGANLINVGGIIYGTTEQGGERDCAFSDGEGCGTVFSITPGGKENVLHRFGKGTDGSFPFAGLVDVDGTLYGTTGYGGEYGVGKYGTVFSITPSGKESVLHSFGEDNDGSLPEADLLNVNGTLYGTTWYGGTQNDGTIFSVTRGGRERVVHSFNGTDGAEPYGGLIDVGGKLYGTTIGGGKYCVSGNACGTVFSITPGGAEIVLHDFANGTDGVGPLGDLIYKNGSLYGVTEAGGAYAGHGKVGGTVFSLTP